MNYEERLNRAEKELKRVIESHNKGILMEFKVRHMKDQRVCEKCLESDGFVASVIDAKIGVNHPPFHDGCRCLALYSISGIAKK